jgi:hypothetical protein
LRERCAQQVLVLEAGCAEGGVGGRAQGRREGALDCVLSGGGGFSVCGDGRVRDIAVLLSISKGSSVLYREYSVLDSPRLGSWWHRSWGTQSGGFCRHSVLTSCARSRSTLNSDCAEVAAFQFAAKEMRISGRLNMCTMEKEELWEGRR